MTKVIGFLALLFFQVFFVGERVPSPVAHRVERNAIFVIIDITLQACYINGGGEVSITHSERCQRVCFGDNGTITKENSLAIYRGCYVFSGVS